MKEQTIRYKVASLQIVRNCKGITAEELAQKVGLSVEGLKLVEERGERPGDETLTKICEALSVPVWCKNRLLGQVTVSFTL